ncbi:MAG TPA: ATP-binding protein [Armatimonadota bacterium]|jgi:signal transduction histidine kinase
MATQAEYKLRVLSQEMAGLEFPLTGPEATIGRLSSNQVCLPLDLRASRHHARLTRSEAGWVLSDEGSANGTYIGQRRVHAPTLVTPGDQIRIGRTWLQLVASTVAPAPEVQQRVEYLDSVTEDTPGSNVVYSVAAEPTEHEEGTPELRQRLEVLTQVSQVLTETLDLDELLQKATDLLMEVLPAERAFLLLSERGEFVPRVVRHREPVPRSEGPLTLSRNIVERATRERRIILSSDASADERFADLASVRDFQIRSTICAPLVRRGEVLGMLFMDTTSGTHIFTENDVDLVRNIAAQAAAAIETARLYTQLRRAYDELEEAQDQLIRSEKLSTIGTLAASLAHDMSNIISPLAPLIGMLVAGQQVPDEARDILKREVRRLGTLVQRLYSFAQVDDTKPRAVQINDVLQEGIALLTTEALHRKVQLETSLADNLPPINVDPDQIYRAVLNLVMNALDATEGQPAAAITVSTSLDEDEVVIGVADNGPGIPEELQAKLFQPFFTTRQGGTGLGLYSCRRIIEEESGGTVQMDSRPGQGTKIWLRLPAMAEG